MRFSRSTEANDGVLPPASLKTEQRNPEANLEACVRSTFQEWPARLRRAWPCSLGAAAGMAAVRASSLERR